MISHTPSLAGAVRYLPSSKSISNRALICEALGSASSELHNLSTARDTQLMQQLLRDPDRVIDARDAGTTFRFLTAYFAATGQPKVLTGSARMKERPISLLVTALRELGCEIRYLEKEGFPPIEILRGVQTKNARVEIDGHVSSQYISALMMIAPRLPHGLTISIKGKLASVPYVRMTASLLQAFGIETTWTEKEIKIGPQAFQPAQLTIEADWSAASYWFSFVALAKEARLVLLGVKDESWQGDRVIVELMKPLGVQSVFTPEGLVLTKGQLARETAIDFADCPDLAQTVLPAASLLGVPVTCTGLETLRIKETDRIAALQTQLLKVGSFLHERPGYWELTPATQIPEHVFIETYHDHRMAMGFAPWATRMAVSIEDARVVDKSYPSFWQDLATVGVPIRLTD